MKAVLEKDQVSGFCDAPSARHYEHREAIADTLEALAIELRSRCEQEQATIPTQGTLVTIAAKVYSARREIDRIFGIEGFAVSPAWDIMLDLYQAKILGKRISVTSACIGGACPPTTGLRWLQALENSHLIDRVPDPEDKRRGVVQLTDGGKVKVEQALASFL